MPSDSEVPVKTGFVSILPAPADHGSRSSQRNRISPGSSSRAAASVLAPKRQKRGGAGRFACDACRSKKSACNGEQPCLACNRRRTKCQYTAPPETGLALEQRAELGILRQEAVDLRTQLGAGGHAVETLDLLKALPEGEAMALFCRLRAAAQSADTASVITTRDIAAPERTSLEFELMIRYPMSYSIFTESTLALAVSSDPASSWHQANKAEATDKPPIYADSVGSDTPTTHPPQLHDSAGIPAPVPPPAETWGSLCDARLGQFEISNWLETLASTEFAARAISHYLTTDHPVQGFFHADLFLDDLVAHKTEFCSPLLLSSVLAFACQGCIRFDPEAADLSHDFFAEAERLYNEERTQLPQCAAAVMTVAATQLLSAAAACHGREAVAHQYLESGIQLARENGLLAVERDRSAKNWLEDHVVAVKAASHTAWGTFCNATLRGINYHNSYIDTEPWLPIPGTVIKRFSGEEVPFDLPEYMGSTFTELCRLAPAVNSVLRRYYNDGAGVSPTIRASLDFSETVINTLLAWADGLPVVMARVGDIPYHVAVLHVYFHATIIDTFRPLLYRCPGQTIAISRCSAESRTPLDLYHASMNQLKHLLLSLRTQYHHRSTSSIMWQNALLYVANDCLLHPGADEEAAARRAWFLACIDGYRALAPQFGSLLGDVVRALLGMAVARGVLSAAGARALLVVDDGPRGSSASSLASSSSHAAGQGKGRGKGSDDAGALSRDAWGAARPPPVLPGKSFIVDLNTAAIYPNMALAEVLTNNFEGLAMPQDYGTPGGWL